MWITSSTETAKTPTNIALGNFDGVHLGHQRVMAQILGGHHALMAQTSEQLGLSNSPLSNLASNHLLSSDAAGEIDVDNTASAEILNTRSVAALQDSAIASGYSHLVGELASTSSSTSPTSGSPGGQSYTTVVTFLPHPQEYFSGVAKPLLTPIQEKTWQLAHMGIQQLVMLPFNQAIAQLSPEAFVKQILIDGLHAQRISVGNDFRFGKGRAGTAEMLEEVAAQHNVPVTRVALKQEDGNRISSSRIRQALQTGELAEATRLLGRPYILTGKVVRGQQIGRTIGFATANLRVPADKYLPRIGVYSVRVYGENINAQIGVMNIGNRPTVGGQSLSVEVHLLNWAGDLYGKTLTVSLETFIRPEQKFESLTQLKTQIEKDSEIARSALALKTT